MTGDEYLNWLSQLLFPSHAQATPNTPMSPIPVGGMPMPSPGGMQPKGPVPLPDLTQMAQVNNGANAMRYPPMPPPVNNGADAMRFRPMPQPVNNGANAMRFRPMPQAPVAPGDPGSQSVPLPPPRPQSLNPRVPAPGAQYQSNNQQVGGAPQVNWGDSSNPADFFRADQAMRGLLG